jgi:serine/threonine protein kinase
MGLSEVQQQFTAYGSGRLPALELRNCIRSALTEDPQLSLAFLALAEAYRRANLIDAALHSTINSDIAAVTRPDPESNGARFTGSGGATTGSFTGAPSISPYNRVRLRDDSLDLATREATAAPVAEFDGRTAFMGATTVPSWEGQEPLIPGDAPLYPGSVLRNRFVLLEQLGHGGMGVVYKAFDRTIGDVRDRYVAIKVLDETFKRHPLAVWTLQRETRKAQKLAHPNIASVYDFDRDGDTVYMVMEFLPGRSLDVVIREESRGGMPVGITMRIAKSLGAALSFAHEQGVIHSDFKPSNAFVTHDGKVKVLDFGIARATPARLASGDATLFDARHIGAISPTYASLEMLKGEAPDVRDDVYALACVIYEMLSGSHPFKRIDALKACEMGLKPRAIRKLAPAQWRALKQGLAFERRDRSPSIESLVSGVVAPRKRAGAWMAAAVLAAGAFTLAGAVVWRSNEPHIAALRHSLLNFVSVGRSAAPVETHFASATPIVPAAVAPTRSAARRQLAGVLSRAEATQAWAAELQYAVGKLAAIVPPNEPALLDARRIGVQTFVAAASTARSEGRFDDAESLLDIALTLDPQAPQILEQSGALARDRQSISAALRSSEAHVATEATLKEKFEAQATATDITGASATASALERAYHDSPYVVHDVPRILTAAYLRLAKTQLAAGQVDDSLQTLATARRRFGRDAELRGLEARYVSAADVYDRLRMAVTLNLPEMQQALETLRSTEGDEYEIAAQMLATTLANRIADQRAAGRVSLADTLLQSGRRIFPSYSGLLERGTPGLLPNTAIIINGQ